MTTRPSESWHLLLGIVNTFHVLMQDVEPLLEHLQLDPKSFFLLTELELNPNPAQLAKKLMLPGPTITFLVKRLEKKNYVVRKTDSKDLRKFHLTMTPEGKRALKKAEKALNDALDERLAVLTLDQQQTLNTLLDSLQTR